ncbi:hypothetical protein FRC15_003373, partial [Serendipita sp. 397]
MASNVEDEDKGQVDQPLCHCKCTADDVLATTGSYVTVETPINSGYRVKLKVDGSDIQLTRQRGQTSMWTPPKSLEVSDSSKVQATLKAGHTVAG